jgi:hypothetical protein
MSRPRERLLSGPGIENEDDDEDEPMLVIVYVTADTSRRRFGGHVAAGCRTPL